jgi:hypothetical protein
MAVFKVGPQTQRSGLRTPPQQKPTSLQVIYCSSITSRARMLHSVHSFRDHKSKTILFFPWQNNKGSGKGGGLLAHILLALTGTGNLIFESHITSLNFLGR